MVVSERNVDGEISPCPRDRDIEETAFLFETFGRPHRHVRWKVAVCGMNDMHGVELETLSLSGRSKGRASPRRSLEGQQGRRWTLAAPAPARPPRRSVATSPCTPAPSAPRSSSRDVASSYDVVDERHDRSANSLRMHLDRLQLLLAQGVGEITRHFSDIARQHIVDTRTNVAGFHRGTAEVFRPSSRSASIARLAFAGPTPGRSWRSRNHAISSRGLSARRNAASRSFTCAASR